MFVAIQCLVIGEDVCCILQPSSVIKTTQYKDGSNIKTTYIFSPKTACFTVFVFRYFSTFVYTVNSNNRAQSYLVKLMNSLS